jgi:hypothetical protein
MTDWVTLVAEAPRIAEVFRRRLAANGLGLLATLRADGFPRVSPMEPKIIDERLWLGMMPSTTKSADLRRDPRFCLHSATEHTQVTHGDAKLWGRALDVTDDAAACAHYAEVVLAESGFDLREQPFDLFDVELTGAAAVQVGEGRMTVLSWRPGRPERGVDKV